MDYMTLIEEKIFDYHERVIDAHCTFLTIAFATHWLNFYGSLMTF